MINPSSFRLPISKTLLLQAAETAYHHTLQVIHSPFVYNVAHQGTTFDPVDAPFKAGGAFLIGAGPLILHSLAYTYKYLTVKHALAADREKPPYETTAAKTQTYFDYGRALTLRQQRAPRSTRPRWAARRDHADKDLYRKTLNNRLVFLCPFV